MKKNGLFVCVLLATVVALLVCSACSKSEPQASGEAYPGGEMGNGARSFAFSVVGVEGETVDFTIKTDKEIVGDALEELGLISGEDGAYGMYVKNVNGTTLDYDKDGKYWAFYINDEYAVSGVDATEIDESAKYSFRAE